MSVQPRSTGSVIVCDLCGQTSSWDDMIPWWAGVDRNGDDLHLCEACRQAAYYCDRCQSIHRFGMPASNCSYALCPRCERMFRAHPGYSGACPTCLYASYDAAKARSSEAGVSERDSCA